MIQYAPTLIMDWLKAYNSKYASEGDDYFVNIVCASEQDQMMEILVDVRRRQIVFQHYF